MLAFQKEVVERAWHTHYQDRKVFMAKANKLQKEIQMIEIDVQKLQLQMNIDWEPITMEN